MGSQMQRSSFWATSYSLVVNESACAGFKLAVIWWGDPHFQTQDGLNYTFNGLGEYWMVKSDSFELQARTDRAWNSTLQPSTTGTVFAAVAGRALYEESNATTSSARVHVEMAADRTSGTINDLHTFIFIKQHRARRLLTCRGVTLGRKVWNQSFRYNSKWT